MAENSELTLEERQSRLAQIAAEVAACTQCPLHNMGRTKTVPGAGPADAKIMFIGEAPGFYEDKQGLPFVGASGKYLEELLGTIGLSRKDVFISNMVKCRPPNNRDPLKPELDACEDYLDRQIAIIKPRIIITLGRFSMARYFPDARIMKVRGTAMRKDGRIYFPMLHPAAALRNPKLKADMETDIKKAAELIKEIESTSSDDPPADPEPPKQLSLF